MTVYKFHTNVLFLPKTKKKEEFEDAFLKGVVTPQKDLGHFHVLSMNL